MKYREERDNRGAIRKRLEDFFSKKFDQGKYLGTFGLVINSTEFNESFN